MQDDAKATTADLHGLDLLDVLAIRAETGADERTIRKRLRGERVKGSIASRIDRAIAARRSKSAAAA